MVLWTDLGEYYVFSQPECTRIHAEQFTRHMDMKNGSRLNFGQGNMTTLHILRGIRTHLHIWTSQHALERKTHRRFSISPVAPSRFSRFLNTSATLRRALI